MSLEEACGLSEDEGIVLSDDNIGRNRTLVLTNLRLVFLKSKGRVEKTYEKEDEIPLEDIVSAHYDRELEAIVLELKNDQRDLISFVEEGFGSLLGGSATSEIKQQATIDRWINAINDRAGRVAGKLARQVRCSYCRQLYDENLTNCPRCGASR